MNTHNVNSKLFDSLIESFNRYNNQLSEISTKNMQNFANLFSGFTSKPMHDMFNIEANKNASAEQVAKINAFVQENMADFSKLCESSSQISQEYKALMMKVIDFYLQLYPSQKTYDLAEHFKKAISDSLSMNKDCGNLFQDFMKTITTNFSANK